MGTPNEGKPGGSLAMGKRMCVCVVLFCGLAVANVATAGNYIWTEVETAPSVKFGYVKAAGGSVYVGGE